MGNDLRDGAIEAMADAWARFEEGGDYEMPGAAFASLRAVSRVHLDALLGFLNDHADEWIDKTGTMEWHDWSERAITNGLLAVLREASNDSE